MQDEIHHLPAVCHMGKWEILRILAMHAERHIGLPAKHPLCSFSFNQKWNGLTISCEKFPIPNFTKICSDGQIVILTDTPHRHKCTF